MGFAPSRKDAKGGSPGLFGAAAPKKLFEAAVRPVFFAALRLGAKPLLFLQNWRRMMAGANPVRGEAELCVGGARLVLRPSFQALVAAEGELGSLFALVERAADGRLLIGEVAALFWHCLREASDGPSTGSGEALTRERVGEAVAELGLARVAPVLKALLGQILAGASTSSA